MGAHDKLLAERFLNALSKHLAANSSYALLDYPDYTNVGDAAIFLGQSVCLERLGAGAPQYVADLHSFEASFLDTLTSGPVLLQGGGNFGDLWPRHQLFRINVLKGWPHRKVVQLPQSIHFNDNELLETTKAAIGNHPDFTLMVRDHQSLNFARSQFDCEVELVPDAAHALTVQYRKGRGSLAIIRMDKESDQPDLLKDLEAFACVVDWPETQDARRLHAGRHSINIRAKIPFMRGRAMADRHRAYVARARERFTVGMKLLQSAEMVVSDRLHAHILSEVAEIPHIALDNAYGKISRYIDTWGNSPLAQRASNSADALKLLSESGRF